MDIPLGKTPLLFLSVPFAVTVVKDVSLEIEKEASRGILRDLGSHIVNLGVVE
jgi:hypothetical protein